MSNLTQEQLKDLATALNSVSVADLVKQAQSQAEPKLRHVLERAREFATNPQSYSETERSHLVDGITAVINQLDK